MRIPTATYRLQLNKTQTLQHAASLVPYLDRLGASDLYASPILRSRTGSGHGYDVTDPARVDPERGGDEGMGLLHAALDAHRMGLLVDIVPNHMAAHPENPWWADVLRHGTRSRYAHHFDIEWESEDPELRGRLLVPFVDGAPRDLVLGGKIRPAVHQDAIMLDVAGLWLPLDPKSLLPLVEAACDAASEEATRGLLDRVRQEAAAIPPRTDAAAAETRAERTARFDAALAEALADPAASDALASACADADMEALLDAQAYVLEDWRRAPERVNYRRFFDINDLICLRVQDPSVFHDAHRRLHELAAAGVVTGLRVDHVDGLVDPQGYLERLQDTFRSSPPTPDQQDGATRHGAEGFYVIVEKILVGPERLPAEWPVQGTTGYESAAVTEGLFVDASGLDALDAIYSDFIGGRRDYAEVVHEAKRQVIQELFPGVFRDLARRLHHLAEGTPYAGVGPEDLRAALEATAAAFPVYRTYCRHGSCTSRDHRIAQDVVQAARRRHPELDAGLQVVEAALLHEPSLDPEAVHAWVQRWQSTTGPVMAKGYEDTALYRYFSLVSLNEVGDRPGQTVWLEAFHQEMAERLRRIPHSLNAGSTHDSKRSEDVRARLNALSEIPHEWAERIREWHESTGALKEKVGGRDAPGPNTEYLLYETLVGAWPLDPHEQDAFADRVVAYMQKAAREAKRETHWLRPDAAYEAALEAYTRRLLVSEQGAGFRRSLNDLVERVAPIGALNSLAQTVLRTTIPGIPDTYQGQELWDLSLVDPDNRRPVDFARRAEVLEALDRAAAEDRTRLLSTLLSEWQDGRIKTYVLSRLLRLRRQLPALFQEGEYLPLRGDGRWGRHVVGFARHLAGEWAVVAVPRSTHAIAPDVWPLGPVWEDTSLRLPAGAPGQWQDLFSGDAVATQTGDVSELKMADVWRHLPVALLRPA